MTSAKEYVRNRFVLFLFHFTIERFEGVYNI
ncbi:Uncharacterised protein [Streptococcus pneumoniae]|nr:Uncharacterised protein [Streptococcus pneumoniae]